ncbi:MAG: class I SAM-dependent methyltransferase [Ignavibacteriaceae bacterium]
MTDKYKSTFWDERYSSEEYVYGTEPNKFFKEQIDNIRSTGRLLLPGEGEGRNAVYAAKCGWSVDAFDQSNQAKSKALQLADKNGVRINYQVNDLNEFSPQKNYYDAVAIVYVHLAAEYRKNFNRKLIDALKVNGRIIIELFSKDQFGKTSGGPQDLNMLYSLDEIKNDFCSFKTILLKEEIINIEEGEKHKGEASVIRFVGEKI